MARGKTEPGNDGDRRKVHEVRYRPNCSPHDASAEYAAKAAQKAVEHQFLALVNPHITSVLHIIGVLFEQRLEAGIVAERPIASLRWSPL